MVEYRIGVVGTSFRRKDVPMKQKHITSKEMPVTERPYERCMTEGPAALTDAELLAVIIRTGSRQETALQLVRRLLAETSAGTLGSLRDLSLRQLQETNGIGKVKAIQIQCALELGLRMVHESPLEKQVFSSPEQIARIYMPAMGILSTEQVRMLSLDTRGSLLKDSLISSGTVNASLFSPREILLEAFRWQAVKLVLLHNHPSGDPSPSAEDIHNTKKIAKACEDMGMSLIDHIIIGRQCYVSLKQDGMF